MTFIRSKQIKRLEGLHEQKTQFIKKESNIVKQNEEELQRKIERLDHQVKHVKTRVMRSDTNY